MSTNKATKSKPDFSGFTKGARAAKEKPRADSEPGVVADLKFRHLQVRLERGDAIRFRRAAEDHGLTLQTALVEAINHMMAEWGEPPVANPGTASKK
jgi:hypothetical protein